MKEIYALINKYKDIKKTTDDDHTEAQEKLEEDDVLGCSDKYQHWSSELSWNSAYSFAFSQIIEDLENITESLEKVLTNDDI